jgi:hypothetical protein
MKKVASRTNRRDFLSGTAVAVSVSDSPDLDVLGLSSLHLQDAATEIARHLLVAGAELVYGGDLRNDGFTLLLFELVARHWRDIRTTNEVIARVSEDDGQDADERVSTKLAGDAVKAQSSAPALTNYLPWPVNATFAIDDIEAQTGMAKRWTSITCPARRQPSPQRCGAKA